MKPIAIFYHCLFYLGDPPNPLNNGWEINFQLMTALKKSGLRESASEMAVGINGGRESQVCAEVMLPKPAHRIFHGLQCHNECRTILALETWLPGHEDWYVFYFHVKGATHVADDPMREKWRGCMVRNLIGNWRRCVADLDGGAEAVGCHWMTGAQTPPGQSIFAGNFWWAKASFLITLPSIMKRDRIKVSGLDSVESRYEGEVWLGNGPRLPKIVDYHPGWNPSRWQTCIA